MRCSRHFLSAAVALVLAVPSAARSAEYWVDAEPTAQRVKSQWKEGRVETATEMGESFVRITTDGKANPTLAAMDGITPGVDATHRFVKVLLRVYGFENLSGIEIRVGSDSLKSAWYAYTVPLYSRPRVQPAARWRMDLHHVESGSQQRDRNAETGCARLARHHGVR